MANGWRLRPGKWELTRRRVLRRDGYRCQACGSRKLPEVDHIWPQILGGTDADSNLQTLCRRCNGIKGQSPMSHAEIMAVRRLDRSVFYTEGNSMLEGKQQYLPTERWTAEPADYTRKGGD